MIFDQMYSAQQDYQRRIGYFHSGMEHMRASITPPTEESTLKWRTDRYAKLLAHACLPIEESANKYGFSAEEYRQKARRDEALLFVTEDGEEFVPGWSLDKKGQVIPAAITFAKAYVAYQRTNNAGTPPSPVDFCDYTTEHQVYMDASMLKDETGKHQPLTNAFERAPYEDDMAEPEINIAGRSIKKALHLTADGYNNDYVSAMLAYTTGVILRKGHGPDSAEDIARVLRKEAVRRSVEYRGKLVLA